MEEKNISGSNEHRAHEHHHEHEHLAHEHHTHEVKGDKVKCRLTQCWEKCRGISVKTAVIIAVVLVLLTLLFVYKGLFVVAMVNGSPISRYSIVSELETRYGKTALENLIVEKLVIMEAKKNNIEVAKEDIDKEITNLEAQIKSQGGTLDEVLSMQGMTIDNLKYQISLQKKLEGLLADKLTVTDEEIAAYITDNKVQIPAGEETAYKEQIGEQLKQEKLGYEAGSYIESLKTQSSVKYFVNY